MIRVTTLNFIGPCVVSTFDVGPSNRKMLNLKGLEQFVLKSPLSFCGLHQPCVWHSSRQGVCSGHRLTKHTLQKAPDDTSQAVVNAMGDFCVHSIKPWHSSRPCCCFYFTALPSVIQANDHSCFSLSRKALEHLGRQRYLIFFSAVLLRNGQNSLKVLYGGECLWIHDVL